MKKLKLVPVLIALLLLACFSGVQGQMPYTTMPASNLNMVQGNAQYSEYYNNITGQAPSSHIAVPQQISTAGMIPSTVYVGMQQQAVPFAQYQSSPTYAESNSLWIQGSTNWTQYAVVPFGTTLSLIGISPKGGSGILTDNEPDDLNYSVKYFFYPESQIAFYADAIGRHVLTFTIGNQISNPVSGVPSVGKESEGSKESVEPKVAEDSNSKEAKSG